jgi:CrcB protein
VTFTTVTTLATAGATHSPTLALALAVAVAGGVGAVLRALVIHHVARRRSDPLPVGTVVVNATGSLSLGPHELTVAGVGLCGGYTTWSTASWESIQLVRGGHRPEALFYTFGGLFVCLAAAAAGVGLAAVV